MASETLALVSKRMAGRKKENYERGRVEFMADPAWIERADDCAKRLGFGNLSAFLRFVTTQYMDQVDVDRPPAPRPRPKP